MSNKVLIKNYDTEEWSVLTPHEIKESGFMFHKPLEVVLGSRVEDVEALEYMAKQMNRSKSSETYWIHHAKAASESGRRIDYAKTLMAIDSCVIDLPERRRSNDYGGEYWCNGAIGY